MFASFFKVFFVHLHFSNIINLISNILKANKLFSAVVLGASLFAGLFAHAQSDGKPSFNEFKLETRADFQYNGEADELGFAGRYLTLHLGGNLTDKLSYYYRQQLKANDGGMKFYDNTDFLWINYQLNKNWSVRLGKDALMVGGFEYDARPIDVMYSSYYWDNYYCFQLGATGFWTSNDGNHKVAFQFGNSPYAFTGSPYGENDRFSYNLMWMGSLGKHVSTLWSVNAFQYSDKDYMGNIALGTKLTYDKWEGYLDLIHRDPYMDFSVTDFSIVSRIDWKPMEGVKVFFKGAYEYNDDMSGDPTEPYLAPGLVRDIMSVPNSSLCYYGLGVEYRPEFCRDLRFHCFVAEFDRDYFDNRPDRSDLVVNLGMTWQINFLKYMNK